MGVLLALGAEGVRGVDANAACPLERASRFSTDGRLLVDNLSRRCAFGKRVFPCAPEITDGCCWRGCPVLLSGEGDSVTLHAPDGMPLWTAVVGFAPRALCMLPGGRSMAVACGLTGEVQRLRLPDLACLRRWQAPGAACCLALRRDTLFVACAVGEEEICGLLCSLSLQTGLMRTLLAFPGLPGALCVDEHIYLGATERLYCLSSDGTRLIAVQEGYGLPCRILAEAGRLWVADPVEEALFQADVSLRGVPQVRFRGPVMDACRV